MLKQLFPNSTHILAQIAVAKYNARGTKLIGFVCLIFLEFDEAQEAFESLLEQDPYRIENIETFSNILFVKEDRAKLSYLAHATSEIDKYRPETCCIIGNFKTLIFF
jgi:anaphase-promoting complex subunit 8